MPDQQTHPAPEPASAEGDTPYVLEHYGFVASSEAGESAPCGQAASGAPPKSSEPLRRPVRARRRKVLAAGVLGLVLAGGIGGVASAATVDTGPDPHRRGDRDGVLTVDAGGGAGQPTSTDGEGGRR